MTTSAHLLPLGTFFCLLSHCAFGDVSCVFEESCILPCSFTPGEDPVIHWMKGETPVYSYYRGKHQLHLQHKNYTDRTSLSDHGIQTGNASLQLHQVTVSDEGRYRCYVSTISSDDVTDSDVNLRVYAPVLGLSLQKDQEQLICRSDNIYPRPAVTWTFSPGPADPQTSIKPSQTGLFSVLSSVLLTQRLPLEHSCNISTEHSWRSATYRRNREISKTDSVTVPCTEPTASVKSLVWRFNPTQTILTKTSSELVLSEVWRPFVDELTESNSLVVKNLTQDQLGLFSCELFTESEEFSINTEVSEKGEGDSPLVKVSLAAASIVLLITIIITIIIFLHIQYLKRNSRRSLYKRSKPVEYEDIHLEESGMMTNIRHNDNDHTKNKTSSSVTDLTDLTSRPEPTLEKV